MVFIFMGPSCTGKSTAAEIVGRKMDALIISGKDYLRFAKSQAEAWKIFEGKMKQASKADTEETMIFVCTEKELYQRFTLQSGMHTVRFTAETEEIKKRFAERMRGNLPKPLEMMLEKQIVSWEDAECTMLVDSSKESPEEAAKRILAVFS